MGNRSLKERLDSYFWQKVSRPKWDSQKNRRKFVRILCEILGVEVCGIYPCYSHRRDKCMASNGGKPRCGGACYNLNDECIYYVDDISHSLILEELYHHINHMNDHKAIRKIMWAWYASLNQKKDISKYFKKDKK